MSWQDHGEDGLTRESSNPGTKVPLCLLESSSGPRPHPMELQRYVLPQRQKCAVKVPMVHFLALVRRRPRWAILPTRSFPGINQGEFGGCCRVYTTVEVLQSKGGGVVHDKLLQKGFPLSVSGGSFPPCPPARFTMPATRGKTSLNARDW